MSTEQEPTQARAWRVHRRGKPADVISLDTIPVPNDLKPGEILVNVKAASLNPIGYKLMGLMPNFVAHRPHAIEQDFAGTVYKTNSPDFNVGDEVYGMIPASIQYNAPHQGALSDYLRIQAKYVDKKPSNISIEEAAGLPTVALTAYQALFDLGQLEPGQRVFINGGSTSVGILAIQFAKSIGCHVTASASGKNEKFVRDIGADDFIDYTQGPLHIALKKKAPSPKYNVFLEAVGILDPTLFVESESYLAPNGIFVSVGPQPKGFDVIGLLNLIWQIFLKSTWLGGTNRTWKLVTVKGTRDHFKPVTNSVSEGKVKPIIDSTYDIEDVPKAYERLMSLRATGKVIVRLSPQDH